MASEIEVQARAPGVGSSEKAALLLRLDELLERYLNTLEEYQKAQQQLTSHFASVSASKMSFHWLC